uniref:asparagine--tRNA ligase n=1 Tax=Dendroctonus ponderosae TaxID=77166 RepID=J3JV90_DENPD|nr:unknown [Dendroctonus ponderosae]
MLKTIINRGINLRKNYSQTSSILSLLNDDKLGQHVFIQGWIKALRKQKEVTFLDINDGSTPKSLQIVSSKKNVPKVTVGASVSASGLLKQTAKGQNEVSATSVKMIGECDLEKGYPFAPRKRYEPQYVREYLHLRPRTKTFASVLRLRHAAYLAIHNYLHQNHYINIHTPIITANDCEGAGETFKVVPDNEQLLKNMAKKDVPFDNAYFDTKAYLTVSGQLHLEAAAHALNKVYCFGPTFRAENSISRFHLSEFYMLELEQAFLDDLDDLLDVVEKMIKHVTADLLEHNFSDLETCSQQKIEYSWIDKEFKRIPHEEALDIVTNKLNKTVSSKTGFTKGDEVALTHYFGHVPVFIINWPKEEKPFYMKQINDDQVAAFDLLAPSVGEIVGGSLRENSYEKLKAQIPESNSQLDWYLDLRRFGSVPTGGFGMGFERYLQLVLGVQTIKDCIPFPRWPHNCKL